MMTQQKKSNVAIKRQKEDAVLHKVLLWFGGSLVAEFVLLALGYWFISTIISGLVVLVPIVAVLAMIYYLYQHEFFSITLVSAFGIFGLWLFRKTADGSYAAFGSICLILALIGVAVVAALMMFLQKKGGSIIFEGKEISVFRPNTSYILMYLSCGLAVLALLGGMFLGLSIAYYLIFVLVSWLLIMAVYYTVKMM